MGMEDGNMRGAAPECGGLGWVYHNGHCYLFDSVHTPYLAAEEKCNEVGGYLADVLDGDENNFIKSVLNVINPKDGTDYWLGGLDADRDKGLQWMSGAPMEFRDFKNNDEPAGSPYLHMNFDDGFKVGHEGRCKRPGQRICLQKANLIKRQIRSKGKSDQKAHLRNQKDPCYDQISVEPFQ